ncbi:hypothetical protein PT7_1292 [Pusillimonas sp. T7-7]|uniref:hypothetical protein n=1 Tax=Pusillimonas sp. (strain T7-7) TaxID=1007105 RepID=UPI00020845EE|nr:hypothetical protein [Pusillimonas sp. T7-7]AEC19832.1 hypothetical protein PT7_1292 [Pusillimonas sp. T7-7]
MNELLELAKQQETGRFRICSIASGFIGLGLSLVGFTKLVGTVYPLLGYLGLLLIARFLFAGLLV